MGNIIYFIVATALYFGLTRWYTPVVSEIHTEDIFKDMAHLFTAAMLGAGAIGYWVRKYYSSLRIQLCLWIGIGLTILEIAAFIHHKP